MDEVVDKILSSLGRFYFRHSPIGYGKWRLVRGLDRIVSRKPAKRIITTGDIILELDPSDFIQRAIYLTGEYEPQICDELRARLKPGSIFLDIGANIGYLSLYAARLVGPKGKVISFEPNPSAYSMLRRNLSLNKFENVTTFQLGLSNGPGEASLYLTQGNSGSASLRSGSGEAITINLEAYDYLAREAGWPAPDVVKIDVEGAEVRVLQGMEDLLSSQTRPETVLCEVSEWSLRCLGSSREELLTKMAGHGYKPRIISPIRQSDLTDSIHFQYDVAFTRK
jgi:FkbM family methyltransferase